MSRQRSSRQIWAAPAARGVLSAVGLISALLADGLGDAVSWIALSAPLGVALWYGARKG